VSNFKFEYNNPYDGLTASIVKTLTLPTLGTQLLPYYMTLYPYAADLCLAKDKWLANLSLLGNNRVNVPLINREICHQSNFLPNNIVSSPLVLSDLQKFTISDFSQNKSILSLEMCKQRLGENGILFTENDHYRLRTYINRHLSKLTEGEYPTFNLNIFRNSKKVQSRLFRSSLDLYLETDNEWAKKFSRDLGVRLANFSPIDAFIPISNNGIENKKKTIYYRMITNTLQLDSNIAHYDATVSPNCKYCTTHNSEKYNHWLLECNTLKPIINSIKDFNVSISIDREIILPKICSIDLSDERKMSFFVLHLLLTNYLVANKRSHIATNVINFWRHIETECKLINSVNNSVHLLQNFAKEQILEAENIEMYKFSFLVFFCLIYYHKISIFVSRMLRIHNIYNTMIQRVRAVRIPARVFF
jgi:hypothetical protein